MVSTSKGSCDWIKSIQIIQDNLFILRSVTVIMFAMSPLSGKVASPQVAGIGVWAASKGHSSATDVTRFELFSRMKSIGCMFQSTYPREQLPSQRKAIPTGVPDQS